MAVSEADRTTALAELATANARPHLVQFYEGDAFLVDEVTRYAGAGLGAGDAVVVIATRAHLDSIEGGLRARGLDPSRWARWNDGQGACRFADAVAAAVPLGVAG